MEKEFISLMTQTSGAALVTGMFIWYLLKSDKRNSKNQQVFTEIITKHIRDNTKALLEFAEKIHEFTEALKENKHVMETIYQKNIELKRHNGDYKD